MADPVALDFSKAVSLDAPDTSPVALDFSKAQPIEGQATPATPAQGPPVPKPDPDMQFDNTATALNPTNSVSSPGEASYVAQADPATQDKMLAAAMLSTGGAGIVDSALEKGVTSMVPAGRSAAGTMLPWVAKTVDEGLLHEAGRYMANVDNIMKIAKTMGWTGFGLKEAHDIYKIVTAAKDAAEKAK